MENMAIVVEDEPSSDLLLDEMEIEPPDTLLGLYQGTPLTERTWDYGNTLARSHPDLPGPARTRGRRRRRSGGRDRRDADSRDRPLLRPERRRDRGDRGALLAWRVALAATAHGVPEWRENASVSISSSRRGSRRSSARSSRRGTETFLEIGPGRGALTRPLTEAAALVVACEIDRDLAADLRADAPPNLRVVEGDFLEMTIDTSWRRRRGTRATPRSRRGQPSLQRRVADSVQARESSFGGRADRRRDGHAAARGCRPVTRIGGNPSIRRTDRARAALGRRRATPRPAARGLPTGSTRSLVGRATAVSRPQPSPEGSAGICRVDAGRLHPAPEDPGQCAARLSPCRPGLRQPQLWSGRELMAAVVQKPSRSPSSYAWPMFSPAPPRIEPSPSSCAIVSAAISFSRHVLSARLKNFQARPAA